MKKVSIICDRCDNVIEDEDRVWSFGPYDLCEDCFNAFCKWMSPKEQTKLEDGAKAEEGE